VGAPDWAGELAELRAHASDGGIVTYFDGTLSPIVDDPATALPFDGLPDVLAALQHRFKRVAVVSGRPVAFLQRLLPSSILLSGLYGLEVMDRGRRRDHPTGGAWREVVDDVASYSAARGPAGMRVENKGLSLTLHYRERPDAADDVWAWAERQATRSGLEVRPARMSVELHPPIKADKGTAVLELARGLSAVCFLGDDIGDLPAFDALDRLERDGLIVVRVAVRSDEAPAELLERADIVVDGPAGAAALLRSLLDGVGVSSPR
jgi:trehalose 6-phosphate phosphatase